MSLIRVGSFCQSVVKMALMVPCGSFIDMESFCRFVVKMALMDTCWSVIDMESFYRFVVKMTLVDPHYWYGVILSVCYETDCGESHQSACIEDTRKR